MYWWPRYIQDVITIVFKGVYWFGIFETPQFYSPVERWSQKQVRKVNTTLDTIHTYASDWSLMSIVRISNTCFRTMPACSISSTLFTTNLEAQSDSPNHETEVIILTTKLLTSECGKSRHVTATGLDCILCRSRISWGWPNMSRDQEQSLPSVDILIRLWAFCVPTTLMQYTGCYNKASH